MIDLILRGRNFADLRTFLVGRNIGRVVDGEFVTRKNFALCLWAGSGDMMITSAVLDESGGVTIPAVFAPGKVAILRVDLPDDRLTAEEDDEPDATDPERREQWNRSKVARWIRKNGTEGRQAGMQYYQIDNVRLFKYDDVQAFLAGRGVPSHEWSGGNIA